MVVVRVEVMMMEIILSLEKHENENIVYRHHKIRVNLLVNSIKAFHIKGGRKRNKLITENVNNKERKVNEMMKEEEEPE